MAKLTIDQLYHDEKYNIIGEVFKDFWVNHQYCEDETTMLFLLTVKHTVAATIKMINEGDFVSEFESEMKSLSLCVGVAEGKNKV